MLLQTNSYIVPKEKREEHSRLIRRFRQTLLRLGCDHFEVYEQVGSNWSNSESAGRYVQILRFLDRKHQLAVQAAERSDPTAQAVIADFCDLINFPYQQQQGLFAVGFYTSVLPVVPKRGARGELLSTVEHEVVDDPEAEAPYPGASDVAPVDASAAHTEEAAMPGEEPEKPAEPAPEESPYEPADVIKMPTSAQESEEVFSAEPIPHQTVVTEAVEHEEMLEPNVGHEEPAVEHHTEAVEHHTEAPEHHTGAPEHHTGAPLHHTGATEHHTGDLQTEETIARAKMTDDFMDMMDGELNVEADGLDQDGDQNGLGSPFDEESDDDAANGFIEVAEEAVGQPLEGSGEPAHPHSQDRPPGW